MLILNAIGSRKQVQKMSINTGIARKNPRMKASSVGRLPSATYKAIPSVSPRTAEANAEPMESSTVSAAPPSGPSE